MDLWVLRAHTPLRLKDPRLGPLLAQKFALLLLTVLELKPLVQLIFISKTNSFFDL